MFWLIAFVPLGFASAGHSGYQLIRHPGWLLLMVPAVVVFIVLTVIRVRRGKFHRQRITKKSK